MKTQSQFFLGLLVGTAAGAAMGLLLSPEKGVINQQKVKEGIALLIDNLSKTLTQDNSDRVEDNTMAHIENMENSNTGLDKKN